jgi:predicted HD superfamily hydrolase involved in NAD metabolism
MNDKEFLTLRNKIIKYLKPLLGAKLFAHSRGVEAAAVQIAAASSNYRLIPECSIAALLHDAAKSLTLNQMQRAVKLSGRRLPQSVMQNAGLLHGHVSAIIAQDIFKITSRAVLSAIGRHTLGRPDMNALEKIIFISDYIEPNRRFAGIDELRGRVYAALFSCGLDRALLIVVRDKIKTLTAMNITIDKTLPAIEKKLEAKLENPHK